MSAGRKSGAQKITYQPDKGKKGAKPPGGKKNLSEPSEKAQVFKTIGTKTSSVKSGYLPKSSSCKKNSRGPSKKALVTQNIGPKTRSVESGYSPGMASNTPTSSCDYPEAVADEDKINIEERRSMSAEENLNAKKTASQPDKGKEGAHNLLGDDAGAVAKDDKNKADELNKSTNEEHRVPSDEKEKKTYVGGTSAAPKRSKYDTYTEFEQREYGQSDIEDNKRRDKDVTETKPSNGEETTVDQSHEGLEQIGERKSTDEDDTSKVNKGEKDQDKEENVQELLQKRRVELEECHKKIDDLENLNDELRELNATYTDEISHLKGDIAFERNCYQRLMMENNKNITDLNEKREKIQKLHAMIDDLTSRLSKAAADKMQRNNPNVADLSDEYRATNIAEKYRQLYDAPWTGAFRELRKEPRDDERNVKLLLETLTDIYGYCRGLAEDQERALKTCIQFPVQDGNTPIKDKMEEKQKHALLHLRKQVVVGASQEVFEGYFNRKKEQIADGEKEGVSKKMKIYWQKCVEVCWPMVVHNPPLTFDTSVKAGDPVDEKIYRLRSDGDIVDTLVWPPLYFGNREALLAKGVVEARKTERDFTV